MLLFISVMVLFKVHTEYKSNSVYHELHVLKPLTTLMVSISPRHLHDHLHSHLLAKFNQLAKLKQNLTVAHPFP